MGGTMSSDFNNFIEEKTEKKRVRFGSKKSINIRVEKNSQNFYQLKQGWFIIEGERRALRKGFKSLYDYLKSSHLRPVFIFSTNSFYDKQLPFEHGKSIVLNLKAYIEHVEKSVNDDSYLAQVFLQPRVTTQDEVYEKLKSEKLPIASLQRISHLRKIIEDFEKKLQNNEPENELRDFLANNPEILDPGYYNTKKEDSLDVGRADLTAFKLNKHGLLEDIAVFELKNPDEKLETNHRPHIPKQTSVVSGGLAQVLAYVEEKSFKDKESFIKGYLIVGKNNPDEDLKTIKRLNKFLHNISILTYSEILERAKRILGMIGPEDEKQV